MNNFLIGEECLYIHFKYLQYHKYLVFLQTSLKLGSWLIVQPLCHIKEQIAFPVLKNCCEHALTIAPSPHHFLFYGVMHTPFPCSQAHLVWNGRHCCRFHCMSMNSSQGEAGLWEVIAWHHRLKQPSSYSDLCQRLSWEPPANTHNEEGAGIVNRHGCLCLFSSSDNDESLICCTQEYMPFFSIQQICDLCTRI